MRSCGMAESDEADTIWSNMKAAFEALSPSFRDYLTTLDAVHDFARGFPASGVVAGRT